MQVIILLIMLVLILIIKYYETPKNTIVSSCYAQSRKAQVRNAQARKSWTGVAQTRNGNQR